MSDLCIRHYYIAIPTNTLMHSHCNDGGCILPAWNYTYFHNYNLFKKTESKSCPNMVICDEVQSQHTAQSVSVKNLGISFHNMKNVSPTKYHN